MGTRYQSVPAHTLIELPDVPSRVPAWVDEVARVTVKVLTLSMAILTISLAGIGTMAVTGAFTTYSGPDGNGTMVQAPGGHNVAVLWHPQTRSATIQFDAL
jgi:hypothetical protein